VAEDDAMAAFGVAPGNGPRFVADHVAGTAFEALLVVKQDAAIVGGHEQLGRASPHTRLGGTTLADFSIDGDVRGMRNTKVDGFHAIIEAQRCLRSLLKKRGNRHVNNLEPRSGYVEPAISSRLLGTASKNRKACPPCFLG
jgi:hypothetical protein